MQDESIGKGVGILLMVSVICAFSVNYFSPKGIALVGDWDVSKGVVTAKPKNDVIDHAIEIDTVSAAKKLYDGKGHVFVDARAAESFSDGRIKGAVSLPVGRFFEGIDGFKRQYPADTSLIIYCSGRECQDSHILAQHLTDEGYSRIKVFSDGYPGWEEKGYPVE